MKLVRFMEGRAGRVARGAAGLAMVGLGAALGGGWWALAAVGLVPLAAGVFDFCLIAPIFGAPLHHAHRGA